MAIEKPPAQREVKREGTSDLKAEIDAQAARDTTDGKATGDTAPEIATPSKKTDAEIAGEIKKFPGIEKIIQNVETISDLKNLPTATLIKLEGSYPGVLMYAFTEVIDKKDDTKKIDFSNWKGYEDPGPGTKIKIDFRGNPDAETQVGAADLLPPSVRRITVYPDGKEENARTSERRTGLKGRNDATGFYDGNGYIPIFSGDVVIIGGKDKPEEGIDKEFASRFLNKDGQLDEESYKKYLESDAAKEDAEYLKKLAERNPKYQRGKILSPEEIQEIMGRVETSGSGRSVVEHVLKMCSGQIDSYIASDCGDWARQMYRNVNVKSRKVWPAKGMSNFANFRENGMSAEEEQQTVDMLQPGDWIWYFNNNGYCVGTPAEGQHSAIFIEWIDKDRRIARVASGNGGKAGRVHQVDLSGAKQGTTMEQGIAEKRRPICRIAKPIPE